MLGKIITFGLGVATGIWIAPQVDAVQEFLPQQPATAALGAPIDAANEMPYETPIRVDAITESEDTTEFDAAVEAFLTRAADMAGDLVV